MMVYDITSTQILKCELQQKIFLILTMEKEYAMSSTVGGNICQIETKKIKVIDTKGLDAKFYK
jgi:uncharacterized protein YunC (DUF1805 family)